MVVFQQMVIICILIFLGYFLSKKNILDKSASQKISALIVNVTNPCLLLNAALSQETQIPIKRIFVILGICALAYVIQFIFAYIIPVVIRVKKDDQFIFRLMTIFGNVGFIGIPLTEAVLGKEALVVVSFNTLIFNVLCYTYATSVIGSRANIKDGEVSTKDKAKKALKDCINPGTIGAILSGLIYMFTPKVPYIVSESIAYAGKSTTFLAMIVLGISVAQMPLKEIFTSWKSYLFVLGRMLVMPLCGIFILKLLTNDTMVLSACALMFAVPSANLPLIIASKHGLNTDEFSKGIILTTLLSPITITLFTYIAF